jgi:hypothetical protein
MASPFTEQETKDVAGDKIAIPEIKRRGLLLHLTHYAPGEWLAGKPKEKRHDQATALAVIKAMRESGFNLLMLDIKDAVAYSRLPELKKRYTVPMSELTELAKAARDNGLEFIPKLNFAKSFHHRHSEWMDDESLQPETPKFWKRSFAAIDEVLQATGAKTLHVGMDEDDTRSPDEYLSALLKLHAYLKDKGARMAMWVDVAQGWRPSNRWKVEPALEKLPRDVLLFPWCYYRALDIWVEKLTGMGFDVLGTCGYNVETPQAAAQDALTNTRQWAESARKFGANGVMLTQWIKCRRANRAVILEAVRRCGPVLSGSDLIPAGAAPAQAAPAKNKTKPAAKRQSKKQQA